VKTPMTWKMQYVWYRNGPNWAHVSQEEGFKHDMSFGIALGYGLDDRGVRVPAGNENFSLHHRVQTGSRHHPASYPMGTRGPFPVRKAAGALS
jgi:hypothetical protein